MANPQIVLCDTNILVELSKLNHDIIRELKFIGATNIAVSGVTAAEFIFGALNKSELNKILKALNAIRVIHVNEAISELAVELVKNYALSHTLAVPDALIAATALFHKIPLYTLNRKDFRFISGLQLHA